MERVMWLGLARSGLAVVVALAAIATDAAAQVVRGRVLRQPGAMPVAGAVVLLADSADRTVARALSDQSGRYVLRAPAAGRFRLRTLRIGYAPAVSAPFSAADGELVERDVAVDEIPVRLAEVRITDRATCVAPSELEHGASGGAAAVAVWTAARTALLASVVTDESQALDAGVALFERRLDPEHGEIRSQSVRLRRVAGTQPFLAAPPVTVVRYGFTLDDARGVRYFAPDAEVLLSDVFGAGHCFGIAPHDSAGMIGLAFAPSEERADLVDVAGVLWVDRATAELRAMSFRYTGVPTAVAMGGAGGSLEFARLPTGEWIVERWRVRLPIVEELRRGSVASWRVREIAETGGAVLDVREAGSVVWRAGAATVSGYVTRHDGDGPVAGAVVSLAGTDYAATTDALGTFVIPDVVSGRYRMELHWAPLDSMGVVSHAHGELVVRGGGEHVVRLEAPPLDSGLALVCGHDAARFGLAMVRGVLRRAAGTPPAGTPVRVAWHHLGTNERGDTVVAEGERMARSDAVGRFTVCGVPREIPLDVRVPADAPTPLQAIVPARRPFAWLVVRLP